MKKRPVLYLLPGLYGTRLLLQPLVQELQEHGWQVQVLELPPFHDLSYQPYVDWLAKRLKGQKRYLLVGESFSSPVVIGLAAQRPAGLLGLATLGGFGRCPSPLLNRHTLRLLPLARLKLLRPLRDRFILGPQVNLAQSALANTALAQLEPGLLEARLMTVAMEDRSRDLLRLSIPRLAIHGKGDWLVWRKEAEYLAATGFTLRFIDGPHALALMQPRAVRAELLQFFSATIR